MSMIDNDWLVPLKKEFSKPYYKDLFEFVKNEYSTTVVYPPADDIFNAFHFTPLKDVKVLLLGQDPYHNVHLRQGGLSARQKEGCCFLCLLACTNSFYLCNHDIYLITFQLYIFNLPVNRFHTVSF